MKRREWTLAQLNALLRFAGIDPDVAQDVPVNPLDFLPAQELGVEEIDPETYKVPTSVG